MRKTANGFTIVELLIVIVVIAILAAISIVAFSGIQERATASAVKTDLAGFAKIIEIAKIDSGTDQYPTAPTDSMGVRVSKDAYQTTGRSNWYYCVSPSRDHYALGVVDNRNRGYYQSSVNGTQENVSGVNLANTCLIVDTGSNTYNIGYNWNGTTSSGTWRTWAN